MKNRYAFNFFIFVLHVFILSGCAGSGDQRGDDQVNKKTLELYETGDWLNGLNVTPHPSIDKEEFAKEYHARQAWWDKAFAFMQHTDLNTLTIGDHPIIGDTVFARITEGPLKTLDSSKWEAHKHYHDIHYVIRGKEKIGIGALSSATIIVPYDSTRDLTFYDGQGNYYIGDTSTFFIAFTKQIHRPGLEVDGKGTVKKMVIKIRSSESN